MAAALYYGLDPGMLGRSEDAQPSPRCCADEGCAADPSAGHRTAVVTYLRGPGEGTYLPLLRQLECTLQRSNPGAELGVMAVPGELGAASLAALAALNITLLPVAPLEFPNAYDPQWAAAGCVLGGQRRGLAWGRAAAQAGCAAAAMRGRRAALPPLPPRSSASCPLPAPAHLQVRPQLAQGAGAGADPVPLAAAGGLRRGGGGPAGAPVGPAL